MPQATYRVELEDGHVFDVEVDGDEPPTEEEIYAFLGEQEAQPTADPSVLAQLQGDVRPMASHASLPSAQARTPVAARGTQLDLKKSEAAAPYLLTAASLAGGGVGVWRAVLGGAGLLGRAAAGAKAAAPFAVEAGARAAGAPPWVSVPLGMMAGRGTRGTTATTTVKDGAREVAAPKAGAVLFRQTPAPAAPAQSPLTARTGTAFTPGVIPRPSPSAAPAPPTASTPGLPASSAAPAAASTPALGRPSARAAASTPPTPRISAPTPPAPKGSAATPAPTSDAASWKPPLFSNLPERVPGKVSLNDALAARRSPTPTTQAAKATFNAAEAKVYSQLRAAGKSHQEALAAIEAQRALAATLGTPSSETVRRAVRERNDTGQWERPRPHRSEKR